jgi:hypothetical protein
MAFRFFILSGKVGERLEQVKQVKGAFITLIKELLSIRFMMKYHCLPFGIK